jgi:acyl-CoA hydrolase
VKRLTHSERLVGDLLPTPVDRQRVHEVPDRDHRIAGFITERIANGSCPQVGVGRTPNALLQALRSHRHLGIHTEAFSDGLMDLVECGAVTGSRKVHHRDKHVAAMAISRRARSAIDWPRSRATPYSVTTWSTVAATMTASCSHAAR